MLTYSFVLPRLLSYLSIAKVAWHCLRKPDVMRDDVDDAIGSYLGMF
jgi:hypothetical protein